jgi:hypothetical protein
MIGGAAGAVVIRQNLSAHLTRVDGISMNLPSRQPTFWAVRVYNRSPQLAGAVEYLQISRPPIARTEWIAKNRATIRHFHNLLLGRGHRGRSASQPPRSRTATKQTALTRSSSAYCASAISSAIIIGDAERAGWRHAW